MGCSCNKQAMRNTMPRSGFARPVVGPSAATGGIAASQSPSQIRAAAAVAAMVPQTERNPSGLNAELRLIEKRRRDAIRMALGK